MSDNPSSTTCLCQADLFVDQIRQEAIQALEGWTKSQSLKQVVLTAKKYNVVPWLRTAYSQLVLQSTLPFDELTIPPAVDWETIARLLFTQQTLKPQRFGETISLWDSEVPVPAVPQSNFIIKPSSYPCNKCRSGKICCGYIAPSVEKIFKEEFDLMTKETVIEDPPLPQNSAGKHRKIQVGNKG
jgi:hypothetical protein